MFDFKFKKRVLFIGVPDMAFVGMEMLLKAGANIVGVVGPKKIITLIRILEIMSILNA